MNEKENTSRPVHLLIKFVIFILLMVATFILSYCGVSKWYTSHLNKKDIAKKEAEEKTAKLHAEENAANCSFTVLYLDNPDTEQVDYCTLRVFNRASREMSFFMIPTDSKMTMTSKLQKDLSKKANTEVNREVMLSEVGTYYNERETKYKMITKVIRELIGGVKIDSYEALDYEAFVQTVNLAAPVKVKLGQMVTYTNEMGESVKLTPGEEHEIDGRMALALLTYTDGFGSGDGGRIERSASYLMKYITSITTTYNKKEMAQYLADYHNLIVTNRSIEDEDSETYIKDCLKLTEENISFYTMKGTQHEDIYILDKDKITEDIKILMGEEAYALAATEQSEKTTKAPEQVTSKETGSADAVTEEGTSAATSEETGTETEISSKDKTITIYNGAYINGLAGKWRQRLSSDGYQIEAIFNYTGGTRDNGKIIVREEGLGKDLQSKYFPNAEIELGTPDDGADIQIILGRSEDF